MGWFIQPVKGDWNLWLRQNHLQKQKRHGLKSFKRCLISSRLLGLLLLQLVIVIFVYLIVIVIRKFPIYKIQGILTGHQRPLKLKLILMVLLSPLKTKSNLPQHKEGWNFMDISEHVSKALEGATYVELRDIVENGVKLPDSDMLEALENEFYAQAKEMLNMNVSERAKLMLSEAPYFLDTETTGLSETDQILEIAITDCLGNVLFESKLKPSVEIDPRAQAVHKISMVDLTDAPTWSDISNQVKRLISGKSLVIFNANFDRRMLIQTASAFNEPTDWIGEIRTHCAMYLAADKYGATNQYGTISLINAAAHAGVKWKGSAHGAVADTLATVDLVHAIANN